MISDSENPRRPVERAYLEEKLRAAASSLDNADLTLKERLTSSFDSLSRLEPSDFQDDAGRVDFEAIMAEFTRVGEAGEGEGSVPTTLWLTSDEEAEALAEKIAALVSRYTG